MLNLEQLQQLITFAELGTLSLAAEKLHISQPTITRTMQHLEEQFGVTLFVRGKNRIALNETGLRAVEESRQLLAAASSALKNVREFDKSLHTITVSSCAPAPLWQVLPALSTAFPSLTIASSLRELPEILDDIASNHCQVAIVPTQMELDSCCCIPFLKENLFIYVPENHALASKSPVTFSQLNGFNFLLRSEIGFWDGMCRIQMPSSKFLVQTDEFEFEELVKESALPSFVTNLTPEAMLATKNRIPIPITDSDANVTYSLVFSKKSELYHSFLAIAARIQKKQKQTEPSLWE